MSLRFRIITGFIILYAIAFVLIMHQVVKEVRPRYLETVEESLNDTANILAAMIESDMNDGQLSLDTLRSTFSSVYARKFSARIYDITKTNVSLNVYVTDEQGIVLYDSRGDENIGKDFSAWKDVRLTLQGHYGARATRTNPDDPASSQLHVAAPIIHKGHTVGVVTVVKRQDSVSLFIELARKRFVLFSLITALAVAILAALLSTWINLPLERLHGYVQKLREDKRAALPELGPAEINDVGRALEELVTELEGKKYIENYVHTLAHEMKSPLTSIRAASELLSEDMSRDERTTFVDNIKRESSRLELIIQNMLTLSSLEGKKELVNTELFMLCSMAREVRESFMPQLAEKSLEIDISCEQEIEVTGERFLIRQSLANLVSNAIKFSPEGSEIDVRCLLTGSMVTIMLKDQGPGIPEFALQRIFDRFYSHAGQGGIKGTGLGLTFVREAVLLHGGTVTVENHEKGGVVATITLPVKK